MKKKHFNIITSIIILHSIFLFIWLYIDSRPPAWDQANHIILAIKYAKTLVYDLNYENFILISNYYPPFYHCLTALFMIIFGIHTKLYALTNILFLIILLFSSYFLIKELSNEKTALITTILLSSFPFIIWLEKNALIDIAIASLVPLVYYFINKSDFFIKNKYIIFAGISAGITILIKWTFVIFLIPLFFSAIFKHKSLLKPFKGILLACFSCFLTFIPWYYTKIISFLAQFPKSIHAGEREHDPEIMTIRSFYYYISSLYEHHIGFILTILFFIGIFYFIKYKKNNFVLFFSFSSILIPFILLSLYRNKDPRYIIGYFVFIAFIISFSLKLFEKHNSLNINYILLFSIIYVFFSFFIISPPRSGNWKIRKIFNDILRTHKSERLVITVVPDSGICNESTFKWINEITPNSKCITIKDVKHFPLICDFLITKTGSQGAEASLSDINEFLNKTMKADYFKNNFNEFNRYNLPNNEKIIIYKRKTYLYTKKELINIFSNIFKTTDLTIDVIKKNDFLSTIYINIKKGKIIDKKNIIPIENSKFCFRNVSNIIYPLSLKSIICSDIKINANISFNSFRNIVKKNVEKVEFKNNCILAYKKDISLKISFYPVKNEKLKLSVLDIYYRKVKIPTIITDYLRSNIIMNLKNIPFPLKFNFVEIKDERIHIY